MNYNQIHINFIVEKLFEKQRFPTEYTPSWADCVKLKNDMEVAFDKLEAVNNFKIIKTKDVSTLGAVFKFVDRIVGKFSTAKPNEDTLLHIVSYLENDFVDRWWVVFDSTIDPNLSEEAKVALRKYIADEGRLIRLFSVLTYPEQIAVANDIILKKSDPVLGQKLFETAQNEDVKIEIGCLLTHKGFSKPDLLKQLFMAFEFDHEIRKLQFAKSLAEHTHKEEYLRFLEHIFVRLNPTFQTNLLLSLLRKDEHAVDSLLKIITKNQLRFIAFESIQPKGVDVTYTKSEIDFQLNILTLVSTQRISNVDLRDLATDLLETGYREEAYFRQLTGYLSKNESNVEISNLARHLIQNGYLTQTEGSGENTPYYKIAEILCLAIKHAPTLRRTLFDLIKANLATTELFQNASQRIIGSVELRNVAFLLISEQPTDCAVYQSIILQITSEMERARILREMFQEKIQHPEALMFILNTLQEGKSLSALCDFYLEEFDWNDSFFCDELFGRLIKKGAYMHAYQIILQIVLKEKDRKDSTLLSGNKESPAYLAFKQLLMQIHIFDICIIGSLVRYLLTQPEMEKLGKTLQSEEGLYWDVQNEIRLLKEQIVIIKDYNKNS